MQPSPPDDLVQPLLVVEYEHLIARGLLADARVELIDGRLVAMSPQGGPHSSVAAWLLLELARQLGRAWDVRGHSPLPLGLRSMPEPDVVVAPARQADRPSLDHPRGAVLVVEVAESSITRDTEDKERLYATAGIPTYWLLDLGRGVALVHTAPADGRYTQIERLEPGATLRAVGLDAVAIAVADVLPAALGR